VIAAAVSKLLYSWEMETLNWMMGCATL